MKFDVDIKLNDENDLGIFNGDIELVEGDNCRIQTARNIVKSVASDWYHDNIGADLESFIGLPVETVSVFGSQSIKAALTSHSIFKSSEVFVKGQVIENDKVIFVVAITGESEPLIIEASVTMSGGIKLT